MPKNKVSGYHRQRIRRDRITAWFIKFGAWSVLATLTLLLWHLLSVVFPMLSAPHLEPFAQWQLPDDQKVVLMGDLLKGEPLVTRDEHCGLRFLHAQGQQLLQAEHMHRSCNESYQALQYQDQWYILRLNDSGIVRVEQLVNRFDDYQLQLVMSMRVSAPALRPHPKWRVAMSENTLAVAVQGPEHWWINWGDRANPLEHVTQKVPHDAQVQLLAYRREVLVAQGAKLQLMTAQGVVKQVLNFEADIQSLTVFPGDRALMLGLRSGAVEKWALWNDQGQLLLRKLYRLPESLDTFSLLPSPVSQLVILQSQQRLLLVNSSTGEVVGEEQAPFAASSATLNEGHLFLQQGKQVLGWQVEDEGGVTTFSALWQPQLYEGYAEPSHTWQSTSAADYSEPKYGVLPLLIGSFKAAFLALIVALPLAIGAAIYCAYFAPGRLRNWLKPAVEMVEAVPSVVIGFIAALWLLPVAEHYLLALLIFCVLFPLGLLLTTLLHEKLRLSGAIITRQGMAFFIQMPLLLLAIVAINYLALPLYETLQAMGWVDTELADAGTFSNKNVMVIAIALGIAITPSIFSIAEDALYEVPMSIRRASFALGATQLQALRSVVMKMAMPGILSAIMLGFARAVGETMIVLMITGNTPLADWDLNAGIRTLTANLAIELPKSEVLSNHYQVLFFTAFVLFVFTFVMNTGAELLRLRLRRHYDQN